MSERGSRQKRAPEKRWRIFFLDESGVVLTPRVSKTWAPRGETPVLRHNFGHGHKVSVVSAVCHNGSLHFQTKVGKSFKHPDITVFLEHLLHHEEGEIVLFWGGANQNEGPAI